ncbi:MAG TPA: hypothetical protein DHW02_12955 [Ktedonobacter sp.]|nr:hypothetical protein [Ktedonobacter sp.]
MLETYIMPSQMTLDDLLAQTQQYLAPDDQQRIRRAYELAKEAHGGVTRRSGEPYIQHPLEVAQLLAGMRIDADGIIAALLHDVVEDTSYSLEDLQEQFGHSVASIVDGVTKFDAVTHRPSDEEKETGKEGNKDDKGSRGQQKEHHEEAKPSVSPADKQRQKMETVRKMLLAMAEDPRVVVLKLADRLHNMRTMDAMTPAQQQSKSRETREIYVPLARRLGMALVQEELEDRVLSYLDPERYAWLAREVEEEMKQRQPYIDRVCETLREEMVRAGIHADVDVRWKSLASINRKLQDLPSLNDEKRSEITQLHDMLSFRILVDTDYDCYLALGHIHALWRPKDGRIKDFIATPKVNGYQSLHTTVFCLDNRLAEIQIRTHEMQRTADYGVASYWYLRERVGRAGRGGRNDSLNSWQLSYKEMVSWIEQLREWQRSLPQGADADEFVEAVKGDIFQDQIFVFTPKGEVKDLPRGSTPLDMAYRIHTDLGDHCAGARIITNMDDSGRLVTRLVPLDYELKGGEIVDIMVNRTVHPTRDWLSFARTAAARTKIRRYLKTYEREINMQLGRERLDLALKSARTPGLDADMERLLRQVWADESAKNNSLSKYVTLDDVYVALGHEDLMVEQVLVHLLPHLQHYDLALFDGAKVAEKRSGSYGQAQTGLEGDDDQAVTLGEHLPVVTMAQCCCPIPGDLITGQFTPGKGILVHRNDCKLLLKRRRSRDTKQDASVDMNWLQIEEKSYLAPVTITAHDRSGLLRDVAAVVADAGINMAMVTSNTNTSSQRAVITATLEIQADNVENGVQDQLERLFRRLRQVKNVVNVERALNIK